MQYHTPTNRPTDDWLNGHKNHRHIGQFFSGWGTAEPSLPKNISTVPRETANYANLQNSFARLTPPQDGLNSVFFSFNKYKKRDFSFFAAGFCPVNLAVYRKIMALPDSGSLLLPAMGHWGTSSMSYCLIFQVTSEPHKLWHSTPCGCLPKNNILAYSFFVTVYCTNFIIFLCHP